MGIPPTTFPPNSGKTREARGSPPGCGRPAYSIHHVVVPTHVCSHKPDAHARAHRPGPRPETVHLAPTDPPSMAQPIGEQRNSRNPRARLACLGEDHNCEMEHSSLRPSWFAPILLFKLAPCDLVKVCPVLVYLASGCRKKPGSCCITERSGQPRRRPCRACLGVGRHFKFDLGAVHISAYPEPR